MVEKGEPRESMVKEKNYRYAYLHGFGSSALSYKGAWLAPEFEKVGLELLLPELNNPSFEDLSFDGSLEAIDALHEGTGGDSGGSWRFIGSSMGGYLAARWAELHPQRVDRMILLCPGFGLTRRWDSLLGEGSLEKWKARGYHIFLDPYGRPGGVKWRFIENAMQHPHTPDFCAPTRIIHGLHDEIVPFTQSAKLAESRDHIEIVAVEDEHSLAKSLPVIQREAFSFFEIQSS